jgi:hypothetical protein
MTSACHQPRARHEFNVTLAISDGQHKESSAKLTVTSTAAVTDARRGLSDTKPNSPTTSPLYLRIISRFCSDAHRSGVVMALR